MYEFVNRGGGELSCLLLFHRHVLFFVGQFDGRRMDENRKVPTKSAKMTQASHNSTILLVMDGIGNESNRIILVGLP